MSIYVILAILVSFSAFSSFVQRMSGFGFGIVIMTVLPFIMPSYGEATALSGLLTAACALVPAIRLREHVRWRKMLPVLVVFILASFIAVQIVDMVDGRSLKKIFGGVLVLVSLYFFFISEKIHLKPTRAVQISMGALSGIMGGLFAMQGPPAVIYFIACTQSKDEYIASTQWFFFIGNIVMSLFRASAGFVTPVVGRYWCVAVPFVLLGLWVGAKVSDKIRIDRLRKIVYAFLALAGVASMVF